jgi:D-arabinose 1-dehydrogenase-like Zn-dependent alcohol dehydrogenase
VKAIVRDTYGSADVLELTDIDKPEPGDDEVLLRVHAASVNPADWHILRGVPYIARMQFGLGKPKDRVLGCDVAGHIEAVGNNVTMLQPGEEVFGSPFMHGLGAFAEWACISEDLLAPKPANLSFEQVAAVPLAALTALQALRDQGRIEPGYKVLIIGASGGRGDLRRTDRQVLRCRGEWRVQHEEPGDGPSAGRRARHRLHPRGLHPLWAEVRSHLSVGWDPFAVRVQERAHLQWDPPNK